MSQPPDGMVNPVDAHVVDASDLPPEPPEAAKATSPVQTVEKFCAQLGTAPAVFGAAKAMHRWGEGKELTLDQYLEAVQTAGDSKIGPA